MTSLTVISADLLLLAARFLPCGGLRRQRLHQIPGGARGSQVHCSTTLAGAKDAGASCRFCESIGTAALVLGVLARTASVLLICFMRSAFFANMAVIGGLIDRDWARSDRNRKLLIAVVRPAEYGGRHG
jgi:uncharacterized membrane protein YphA (DoxX/SURF4 family)